MPYEIQRFDDFSEEDVGTAFCVDDWLFDMWRKNQHVIDMLAPEMAAQLGLKQTPSREETTST